MKWRVRSGCAGRIKGLHEYVMIVVDIGVARDADLTLRRRGGAGAADRRLIGATADIFAECDLILAGRDVNGCDCSGRARESRDSAGRVDYRPIVLTLQVAYFGVQSVHFGGQRVYFGVQGGNRTLKGRDESLIGGNPIFERGQSACLRFAGATTASTF